MEPARKKQRIAHTLLLPGLGKDVCNVIGDFVKGQWIADSLAEWQVEHKRRRTHALVLDEFKSVTSRLRDACDPLRKYQGFFAEELCEFIPVDWGHDQKYKIIGNRGKNWQIVPTQRRHFGEPSVKNPDIRAKKQSTLWA